MKKNTVFLVGADTGGHVVPVFSLLQDLEKQKNRTFVFGIGSNIEKKFYTKLKKTKYIKLMAGKFRSGKILNNFFVMIKLLFGFFQSLFLVLTLRPAVVFLKGNYATLPMAYASRIFSIPIIIHESDAVLGRSNRIISKFAQVVFVSYPKYLYGENDFVYSGSILRDLEKNNLGKIKLNSDKKTILVLGGSLGAHSINEVVFKSSVELTDNIQIIHQTGDMDLPQALKIRDSLPAGQQENYIPVNFIEDDFVSWLAKSDLVISRAGSIVMELAALKKATVLIPYPYAAADHQSANARYFVEKDAAVVIDNTDLSPTVFYSTVSKIISSPNKLKMLGEKMYQSVKLDGREIILAEILKYLN